MSRVEDRIVGTWGGREAADHLARLRSSAATRCGFVELRLDRIADVESHLDALLAAAPAPVIATCRPRREGGLWAGDEGRRLALLARAAAAGAAWVDVEHDVPVADVPRGARVLRSAHVDRLPDDLDAFADALLARGDAAKLVARRGSEADVLRLLDLLRARSGRLAGHVIAHPFSRYASALLGAPFVYAALAADDGLGVALPTVDDLLDRADLGRARTGTRAWVLLGADVEASVSPQMLNAAFAEQESDVVALRWSCADPAPALDALQRCGWAGAAVTIPHKETVLRLLADRGAELDDEARATGALNTVVVREGVLSGWNTDVGGLSDAIQASGLWGKIEPGRTAVVVGAGGAARAAIRVAHAFGTRPLVVARRLEAAEALRPLGAEPATWEAAAATRPVLVIDATPAGPPGGDAVVDPRLLPERTVVVDLLVAGAPTALETAARAAGHWTVPGLLMLLHQARRQVELVTGTRPAEEPLLGAGLAALPRPKPNLVLLGLRCAGKTSVGRRLAERLGRPFLDLDAWVAERAGRSPDELIRAGEEERFRALEREALVAAAKLEGTIVAAGGGACLAGFAFHLLCHRSVCVLLDAPDDVLLERLAAEPRAPLRPGSPEEELARQRAERMPAYREVASLVVRAAPGDGVDDVVTSLLQRIEDLRRSASRRA